MGQAFDAEGRLMGEAFGISKQDVFEKLNKAHADAAEIRIRTHTPMPKYRCHKEVWALHIESVRHEPDGSAVLTPSESPFAPFAVSADYVKRHQPTHGGYFVQYEDGYTSFSPAKAFEDGYARL